MHVDMMVNQRRRWQAISNFPGNGPLYATYVRYFSILFNTNWVTPICTQLSSSIPTHFLNQFIRTTAENNRLLRIFESKLVDIVHFGPLHIVNERFPYLYKKCFVILSPDVGSYNPPLLGSNIFTDTPPHVWLLYHL